MIKYFHSLNIRKTLFDFYKNHKILLVILFIGFVIRVLPILWGVPVNPYVMSYHPDEPKVYTDIMNFPRAYLTFAQFKGYGTFIQNSLGMLFLPLKLLKLIASQNIYEIAVIVLSRFINVIIGTSAIAFTYFLAVSIFEKKTALIASAFLTVSFYHVINSSIITLDVAMSLLIVINFQICFFAIKKDDLKSYILLGISSGLLLGTKVTGILFMLIPVVLIFLNTGNSSNKVLPDRRTIVKRIQKILVYFVVASFIFLLFNSYVYLYPARYLNFLLDQKKYLIDRSFIPIWQMPLTWIKTTDISTGFPVAMLLIVGLARMRKRNLYMQLVLFFFLFEYYTFWRWSIQPRYIISIAPLICIFAANAVVYFYEKKNVIIKIATAGVFLFTVIYSSYLSISGILLRFNDTRTEASRYIDKNIKKGSTIGVSYTSEEFTGRYHAWRYPRINYKKYKSEDFINEPDVIILSSYDFYKISRLLNSHKLNDKYELDNKYYREWYRYSPPGPRLLRRFDELLNHRDSKYKLIKTFKKEINVPVEFPPPEIRIYKKVKKI